MLYVPVIDYGQHPVSHCLLDASSSAPILYDWAYSMARSCLIVIGDNNGLVARCRRCAIDRDLVFVSFGP